LEAKREIRGIFREANLRIKDQDLETISIRILWERMGQGIQWEEGEKMYEYLLERRVEAQELITQIMAL
jgi:hypothetical protein